MSYLACVRISRTTLGIGVQFPGIFHGDEDNKATVDEVVDILDMWSFLEESYTRLSKKDTNSVQKKAGHFGRQVVFTGFDGNKETEHLYIAKFLINKLDRFVEFKSRNLNSQVPLIDRYRLMVRGFPWRRELAERRSHYHNSQCLA